MIQKILLIAPPIEDFYQTEIRQIPLGLGYLQASLLQWHPQLHVEIVNFQIGYGKKTIPVPLGLDYLQKYWAVADQSPFCGFYHYYRFGASNAQILEEVSIRAPDLIGISALFTAYFPVIAELVPQIKTITPCPIVIGGAHASADPLGVLASPGVDYVVVGEGERPLVELVAAINGGGSLMDVPNLGHYHHGTMVLNPYQNNFSLAELPAPTMDPHRYFCGKKMMATMITSRSCPHRCQFCCVHTTFGNQYRRRSNQQILTEIENYYRAGIRLINFEDDNLSFSRPAFRELCQQIAHRFAGQGLELVAMNGMSYQSLDFSTLQLMRQAGFARLNLSLVTSNQDLAHTQQRFFSSEDYVQVVTWAEKLGFAITSYQILGLPAENLASMLATLTLNARLPVILGASPFYLIPKSPIAEQLGISCTFSTTQQLQARLSALANHSSHLSRSELYTLFMITRMINFLKSLPFPDGAYYHQLPMDDLPLSIAVRSQWGLQQLQRLSQQQELFFACSPEWKRNENFVVSLWQDFIADLGFLRAPNGNRLFFTRQSAIQ